MVGLSHFFGLNAIMEVGRQMRNARLICGVLLAGSMAIGQTAGSECKKPVLTFSHDVAPILYKHCVTCHHPGDIAPMSLLTYKDVRPWAASIRQAVVSRKMPPWLADPAVGHWSNDPRLSEADIGPSGNGWRDRSWKEIPKTCRPRRVSGWLEDRQARRCDRDSGAHLDAKGPDEYTYVDVPTHFTEDRWIIAAELRPGNRKIVHHAHVFVKASRREKKPKKQPSTPATEYAKWIRIRQGSLEWVRPEAPVIDNGCSVDDNGLFPGSKTSDLASLISSYLRDARRTFIRWARRERSQRARF